MKTKKKNWAKKSVLIILALLILGTSLTGLALAKGEASVDNSNDNLDIAGADDWVVEEPNEIDPSNNDVVASVGYTASKEQEKIDQIKKKTTELRSKRLRKEDTFNYTKEDIERLLLSGATVEDIYHSDQIANEWLVSPDQLVELKRQSSASWDEITEAIQVEKESRLNELLVLYPTAGQQFSKTKITIAEKVEVLELLHENGSKEIKQESLDNAIQEVANNQISRENAYSISELEIGEGIRQ